MLDPHLLPATFDEDEAERRQDEDGGRGQGQSHAEQQVRVNGSEGLLKIVLLLKKKTFEKQKGSTKPKIGRE